ncbi:MAG: glycosyltransferase family 1 protein, partial [Desulforhopalus sp.]
MKISYYMPFKPMDHAHPSGDLVTGTELYNLLSDRGHAITPASSLRCRWIYYKPLTLLRLFGERRRILQQHKNDKPDLWLSYHSYYKAPDLLGAMCSSRLGIPYVIFQGIYSTKRRKSLKTLPG